MQKKSRKFLQFGRTKRNDAMCPHCDSLERHRLFWLYVMNRTNIFDNAQKTMLHVAPERFFESKFRSVFGDNYITADLLRNDVMVKMDITDIQYTEQYFDIIYCSHVLEHVPDDKKAIREFYRVLKNNGVAILNVPIYGEETFEDLSIVDPEERLRVFGQEDHVRKYGSDYVDRLRAAGFKVEIIKVEDLVSKNQAITTGLTSLPGEIYCCRKEK